MFDIDKLILGPVMGVFGDEVLFTSLRYGQQPPIKDGIFNNAYLAVDGIDVGAISDNHMTMAQPALGVRMANLQVEPQKGDELIIKGQTYSIKEVQKDGDGHAVLVLNLGSYEP